MTTQSLADYRREAVRSGEADPDTNAFEVARHALAAAGKTVLMEAAVFWLAGEIEAARRNQARAAETRAFPALQAWQEERTERQREIRHENYQRRRGEREQEIAEHGRVLSSEERLAITAGKLSGAIEAFRESMRLEVTAELLATTFAVDGRLVTWGEATREDHRRRADWLAGHAGATLETAARHEIAISVIDAAGAACLAEIPADRITEAQLAA